MLDVLQCHCDLSKHKLYNILKINPTKFGEIKLKMQQVTILLLVNMNV